MTFVPQIENAVVILFCPARGMFTFKPEQAFCEQVAYTDHKCPKRRHLIQIVFIASTKGDKPLDNKQLVLQSHRFDLKRGAKTKRDFSNPGIKFRYRRFAQLLQL
jgi:hypothetical protein